MRCAWPPAPGTIPQEFCPTATEKTLSMFTRLTDRLLPQRGPAWSRSPRGLLIGFTVMHLIFLIFALIVSLAGNAFSDTNIYRAWAEAAVPNAA